MKVIEKDNTKLVTHVKCHYCKAELEITPKDCKRAYICDGLLFKPRYHSNCVILICPECDNLFSIPRSDLNVAFWDCTS